GPLAPGAGSWLSPPKAESGPFRLPEDRPPDRRADRHRSRYLKSQACHRATAVRTFCCQPWTRFAARQECSKSKGWPAEKRLACAPPYNRILAKVLPCC